MAKKPKKTPQERFQNLVKRHREEVIRKAYHEYQMNGYGDMSKSDLMEVINSLVWEGGTGGKDLPIVEIAKEFEEDFSLEMLRSCIRYVKESEKSTWI